MAETCRKERRQERQRTRTGQISEPEEEKGRREGKRKVAATAEHEQMPPRDRKKRKAER